ncbi:hypothetical protein BH23THE1_BH23THE1_32530 [soil metagenome]
MSYTVRTLQLDEYSSIDAIRRSFGLNVPPFDSIDDDLILMAFTPRCSIDSRISRTTSNRWKDKFGICGHQSLEFYGDRILYDVVASIIYDLFGLSNTPGFLSKLMNHLTSNRVLTDIMLNKDACKLLRTHNYVILGTRDRFHNSCADSLEALIGVLFVHFKSHNVDHVSYIREWLLKNTTFPFFLQEYLTQVGTNTAAIYTIPDKEELIKQLAQNKLNLLSSLENIRSDIGDELYFNLREMFQTDPVDLNEFASRSIIVDPNTQLNQIYQMLGWNYERPKYYPEYESYLIMGYPNSRIKTIGVGNTEEGAEEDARNYLLLMGYIINMKYIPRYFTR